MDVADRPEQEGSRSLARAEPDTEGDRRTSAHHRRACCQLRGGVGRKDGDCPGGLAELVLRADPPQAELEVERAQEGEPAAFPIEDGDARLLVRIALPIHTGLSLVPARR